MRVLTILLILEISVVNSLPFLSNEAKEDFDKSNKALIEMQRRLNKTLSSLDSNGKKLTDAISTVVGKPFDKTKKALTIIQNIMRKAGKDFTDLGKDLKKAKWHKYNGHCYHIETTTADWFTAERNCKKIGGYMAKLSDEKEKQTIHNLIVNSRQHYWIGLYDLVEGQYRWIYDQTLATYKPWYPGYSSMGNTHNCVAFSYNKGGLFFDYICSHKYGYICESNFCY